MEIIKYIFEYLAIIMSAVLIVYKGNSILKYYQQSHYDLSSFKKIIKYYYIGKYQYLIFGVLGFVLFLDFWLVQLVYSAYLVFLLVVHLRRSDIIKLKFTWRIYRNYFVNIVLGTIFVSSLIYVLELPELSSGLAILLFVLPFLVFISSLCILPVELLIRFSFQKKAKRKLRRVVPIVIGITGSFGKTSTKNILYQFLKDEYMTLATRKSYNTINGVCIAINDDLRKTDEVLLVEMGASRVGDLDKLIKLVRPQYAMLTGITAQHLETFKTMENIISEKIKIIESLPKNGIAFINGDDQFIKTCKFKTKAQIISFGLNITNDYYASDLEIAATKMKFKINKLSGGFEEVVETKLLGRHNILNILAAYAVADLLGVNFQQLKFQISMLEPTKHRLSIEEIGQYTLIDDSFNSNNIGFINALEVLGYYSGPRILITPGIVEGGSLEEDMNYSLAKRIVEVVDEVVLIETKASSHIEQGLIDLEYENIKKVEDFKKAKEYVFNKYKKANILIENDISDIYKI